MSRKRKQPSPPAQGSNPGTRQLPESQRAPSTVTLRGGAGNTVGGGGSPISGNFTNAPIDTDGLIFTRIHPTGASQSNEPLDAPVTMRHLLGTWAIAKGAWPILVAIVLAAIWIASELTQLKKDVTHLQSDLKELKAKNEKLTDDANRNAQRLSATEGQLRSQVEPRKGFK